MKTFNECEWYTLQEVAEILDPPLTVEAVRQRLFKPGAPTHRKWRNKWRISKEAFATCSWVTQ